MIYEIPPTNNGGGAEELILEQRIQVNDETMLQKTSILKLTTLFPTSNGHHNSPKAE